jgi:hypothetical protein
MHKYTIKYYSSNYFLKSAKASALIAKESTGAIIAESW